VELAEQLSNLSDDLSDLLRSANHPSVSRIGATDVARVQGGRGDPSEDLERLAWRLCDDLGIRPRADEGADETKGASPVEQPGVT
jgi:hypothetical protein